MITLVFIQIDELENAEHTTEEQEPPKQKSKTKKKEENDRPFSVQTKYKGFEDLLDVADKDPDIVIPKDIQGSVRALHYALRHPLVFTEEPQGFTYKEKTVRPKASNIMHMHYSASLLKMKSHKRVIPRIFLNLCS